MKAIILDETLKLESERLNKILTIDESKALQSLLSRLLNY